MVTREDCQWPYRRCQYKDQTQFFSNSLWFSDFGPHFLLWWSEPTLAVWCERLAKGPCQKNTPPISEAESCASGCHSALLFITVYEAAHVISQGETPLRRHGRELNPGHRGDRQWAIPLSYHNWSIDCPKGRVIQCRYLLLYRHSLQRSVIILLRL